MDGFTTWEVLATYGGCAALVGLLTQFTKGWPYLERLPTQLWSYLLSLGVLILAFYFTGQLTADNAVLLLFNAAIVSLTANGGYAAMTRGKGGGSNG